jgi:hypothetical protein
MSGQQTKELTIMSSNTNNNDLNPSEKKRVQDFIRELGRILRNIKKNVNKPQPEKISEQKPPKKEKPVNDQ